MPTAYKVLGQIAPSATTATSIYTVPSATEAVVSSIVVCNRSAANATFRISVRPDGATLANQHYLAYDAGIAASDTMILTIGVTMDATDVLEGYASTGDLTFHAYGSEVS
jgi:hypothetical protein